MARAGVGPLLPVARRIADDVTLIPDNQKALIAALLLPLLSVTDLTEGTATTPSTQKRVFPVPQTGTLEDKLDVLLNMPRYCGNHLTVFEHVVSESGVNTPWTGRLLESVTKSPLTAILYAYGIRIDPFRDARQFLYGSSGPNDDAFVAVLSPPSDRDLASPADVNIAALLDINVCRDRIRRDEEVLLDDVILPEVVVELPRFDVGNPMASLHDAAQRLRDAGVAV